MKNIVIVGGGSAGWLTALRVQIAFPNLNITVVESPEIGILGAGEGSVPYLISFLDNINIPVSDLIKNCDATIKTGIKFTNWNNDNKFYYHSFKTYNNNYISDDFYFPNILTTNPIHIASINDSGTTKNIDFVEKVSEQNRVPFIYNKETVNNPILHYNHLSAFSIHFNAVKFANRLKEIGITRNIKVVKSTISEIYLDDKNNVSALLLDNRDLIECDFVFDCSGFNRLLIGKKFNSEWKSYNKHLPVDSAVPFFIDMDEEIPPYTEAIAMKYGWMWKIPLQSRYGCGYVFDSSLISEKQAVKEIENFLGFEPEYPRKNKGGFKFNAGYYENSWINNCVSIGLASNFIEPLEATSIWVSTLSLNKLLGNVGSIFNNNQYIRDDFNKYVREINKEIVDFIYYHYMSKRKDTEFWNKFTYKNAPGSLKNKLDLWKDRLPDNYDNTLAWLGSSWLIIGINIGILNKELCDFYIDNSLHYQNGINDYKKIVDLQNSTLEQCIKHNKFLEYLK